MTSILPATLSIVAFFVGQALVTRQRWTGFLIWALSNYAVAAHSALQANAAATCMFLVYFAANMHSVLAWSRAKSFRTHLQQAATSSLTPLDAQGRSARKHALLPCPGSRPETFHSQDSVTTLPRQRSNGNSPPETL
jgi:hypothetical protein